MTEEIRQFLLDNGMVLVLGDIDSGISMWEDVGGNMWTWDGIVEAVEAGV